MALKLNERYPGRTDPSSIDYPQGSFKNRSSPTAKDGTYLEKDWANDNQGFLQSILSYFGVTANGQVDKVGASQYFNALTSSPTETRKGMPQIATQAQANAGTDDSTVITPKKLRAGFSISLNTNGYIAFPTWLGGVILQWGMAQSVGGSESLYMFPLTFPVLCRSMVATAIRSSSTTETAIYSAIRVINTSQFGIRNNQGSANNSFWIAIGH